MLGVVDFIINVIQIEAVLGVIKMNIFGYVAAYVQVGLFLLAFLIAEDLRNGRKIQKRDLLILLVWPLFIFVILILGLAMYSDITSKNTPKEGGGVTSILDSLG